MKAADIMGEVRVILGDKTNVRWPLPELRLWINAGLREIAVHKPNACTRVVSMTCAVGTRQSIPPLATSLLRVIRNIAGLSTPTIGRRAIVAVPREIMDSQNPHWHNPSAHPPQKEVIHAVQDPADQRNFYVWPPNDGTGKIEIEVTRIPDRVEIGASPTLLSNPAYAVEIDLDRVYQNSLVDYALYRAYLKDAGFAGNATRAAAHYQAFGQALGVKLEMELASGPNQTPVASGPAT